MKFLGGFLKFIAILLMLIGAAAGAGFCVFGAMEEMWEPVAVGVGIFLAVLLVALGVLGTGIALSQIAKLKKKVALLEQRLWSASAAPVAAAPEIAPEQPVAPVSEPAPAIASAVQEEKTGKSADKSRIAVIIASIVAIVAIVLVIVIAVGGSKNKSQQMPSITEEAPQYFIEESPMDTAPQEENAEEMAPIEVAELPIGSSLSTGFVDMTFDEFIVEADIQKSVTIDHVTRITGPEPLPGQVYVCLSGTIKATSNTALPVYDFFNGRFQIGDYCYDVTANDCDVLSADGSTESSIDPLMEYEYRIYTAIPEELHEFIAAGEPCHFTFGFYDMFDNQELSYNRSFGDDPIAACPYQFLIPLQ